MSLTTLPPLIGMLLTGLLLQNVGLVHIAGEYREVVSQLRYEGRHTISHSLLDRSCNARKSAGYVTAPVTDTQATAVVCVPSGTPFEDC